MSFPLCFVFTSFSLQKWAVTEAQSFSLVKFNCEPILWPGLEGQNAAGGTREKKKIGRRKYNSAFIDRQGKFAFDEIVEYLINSQIQADSVSQF